MITLARPLAVLGLAALPACRPVDTSRLSPERQAQFARETIRHQAANLHFRYSHDAGTNEAGWEDRVASVVVTDSTVLIYKNEKIGIEITPSSRRAYEVHRDHERVRINAGSGKSRETWSFSPPDDAEAWTTAIRAVIKASKSDGSRLGELVGVHLPGQPPAQMRPRHPEAKDD